MVVDGIVCLAIAKKFPRYRMTNGSKRKEKKLPQEKSMKKSVIDDPSFDDREDENEGGHDHRLDVSFPQRRRETPLHDWRFTAFVDFPTKIMGAESSIVYSLNHEDQPIKPYDQMKEKNH